MSTGPSREVQILNERMNIQAASAERSINQLNATITKLNSELNESISTLDKTQDDEIAVHRAYLENFKLVVALIGIDTSRQNFISNLVNYVIQTYVIPAGETTYEKWVVAKKASTSLVMQCIEAFTSAPQTDVSKTLIESTINEARLDRLKASGNDSNMFLQLV